MPAGPCPAPQTYRPYHRGRLLGTTSFPERVRLPCRTWASQVQPSPFTVIAFYCVKYGLFFA